MNMRALSQQERQEWLNQVQEDILEPNQKICDPHHHLWNHSGSVYEAKELLADICDGHNVISTVFVECLSQYRTDGEDKFTCLGETEYVLRIANQANNAHDKKNLHACAGIVSYANLTLGESVREVIEKHIEIAPKTFRGIRHSAAWDAAEVMRPSHTNPPPFLLSNAQFRRGFAQLAPLQMSFDAWLYHQQISELYHLAKAFPDTTIILDHLGGPIGIGVWAGRRDEIFVNWQQDMTLLATCPNVYVKLGGVAMPVNGLGWHRQDKPMTSDMYKETYGHWIEYAIEAFGTDRCMFESNFPVDRVSISHRTLFNGFKKIVSHYSTAEKDALFWQTAHKAYRIPEWC